MVFRDGFAAPERQTTVRLSAQQRTALRDVLSPADLSEALLAAIEDALSVYQAKTKEHAAIDWRTVDIQTARLRRMVKHASELRRLLPFIKFHDDALAELLDERCADWDKLLSYAQPSKHLPHPRDPNLIWLGFAVVSALDAAHVPLKVGRDSIAVEVLRLVRQWADRCVGRQPRAYRDNYRFSRAVVDGFVKSKTRLTKSKRPATTH